MAFATHQSEEWSQSVSVLSGLICVQRELVIQNGKSQPHLLPIFIYYFFSGDHQHSYPDVTEKIIFPGHQLLGPITERRLAEKLLDVPLVFNLVFNFSSSSTSSAFGAPLASFSADVCPHFLHSFPFESF